MVFFVPRTFIANAAVVYGKCRDIEDVLHLLKSEADATTRAYFISRSAIAAMPFAETVSLVESQDDAAVQQGLLLSMGEISIPTLSMEELARLDRVLSNLLGATDPGVRAAAEWLAGILQRDLQSPNQDGNKTNWFVAENGHRFIVFDGWDRRFAISDAEVTEGQFAKLDAYLQDELQITPVRGLANPRQDYPQANMSFYAAAMYCRWLGEQEGLPPEEQYYPELQVLRQLALSESNDLEPMLTEPGKKRGYRLPSESEWDFASGESGGHTVDARKHPDLMAEYARFNIGLGITEPEPAQVRSLKPNL